jgi:hypothetical protein
LVILLQLIEFDWVVLFPNAFQLLLKLPNVLGLVQDNRVKFVDVTSKLGLELGADFLLNEHELSVVCLNVLQERLSHQVLLLGFSKHRREKVNLGNLVVDLL